jgi:hypothetical protein
MVDLLWCGVDGSDGWRLYLATNVSPLGGSFIELIGFDFRNAAARSTGGRYGRGLPVLVSAKVPGTDFQRLVNFAALVTLFSSVIAGPFSIMT